MLAETTDGSRFCLLNTRTHLWAEKTTWLSHLVGLKDSPNPREQTMETLGRTTEFCYWWEGEQGWGWRWINPLLPRWAEIHRQQLTRLLISKSLFFFFCSQSKILVKCFAARVTFSFGANETCNKRKLWAPHGHCSRMDSPKLLVRSHPGKFNRTFSPEPLMGSCARHSSCSQLALCVGIYLSTDMEPRPDPQITSTNPTPFFTQPRSRSCRYQTPNSWVVPNPWLSFSRFVQFCDLIAFSGTCVSGIFLFSF